MVYLHCGWPKTGTSSIQAALVRNRRLLEEAGFVYPERWRRDLDGSHNNLVELLRANRDSGAGFDEVTHFLRKYGSDGKDILLSSEILSTWLLRSNDRAEAVLNLLAAIRKIAPLRCVWTLRRFDEMIVSLSVQLMLAGLRSERSLERFLGGPKAEHRLFAGMRAVERVGADEIAYIKYEPTGGHGSKLLCALGLSAETAAEVGRRFDSAPRLNASRTHKQMAAVLNADAVAARLGATVKAKSIIHAVDREGFRFDDDRACTPLGPEGRRNLHERALAAAAEHGISQYVRFFANERVNGAPAATSLGGEALTDADLNRLAKHLRQPVEET